MTRKVEKIIQLSLALGISISLGYFIGVSTGKSPSDLRKEIQHYKQENESLRIQIDFQTSLAKSFEKALEVQKNLSEAKEILSQPRRF